jgi:hypothetical protein
MHSSMTSNERIVEWESPRRRVFQSALYRLFRRGSSGIVRYGNSEFGRKLLLQNFKAPLLYQWEQGISRTHLCMTEKGAFLDTVGDACGRMCVTLHVIHPCEEMLHHQSMSARRYL